MQNKKSPLLKLSEREQQFIEQLREHPELFERLQTILQITSNADGPIKSADEVEELLIKQIRLLGNASMTHWAAQAEQRLGEQLKQKDASAVVRKKKTLKWWCVFGQVSVAERIWRTADKNYARLLPVGIGVSSRGRSRRLQRVLTDFGCEHSFALAARQVQEHYGFEIGSSAVRKATLDHARRAQEKLQEEYEKPFRLLPEIGAEHVIAEVDGTMICTVEAGRRNGKRPRQWKEMRLAAAQALGTVQTWYAATFGEVDEAGRRWGHCARAAGWGLNSRIHAVGDGAQWIRLQAQEVFGKQGYFLCDFFHVSEYLGAAAASCRSAAPDQWRRTQQQRLKRGAAANVMAALKQHVEPESTPEENAPVRQGYRYLENRKECLDYPGALKLGLPIGSGMIESGHRHVLQGRLKKAGAAWLSEHADNLANLRVLRANDRWLELWN